ncbi:hypothetical protein PHMEG_0003502 [Phytophthora megakarya]|uniref:Uncharacterized protein n=1 Tax=Phytophthora megakarya TaxID=4795 RepID=A0A225WVY2_9STRA|nr:hypothetical protein PHMEG_0003502 [Phytophthora megakarya]
MTTDENHEFTVYMKGDLDLPAPPTFLTCMTTTPKWAGMLAYRRQHIEVTLITTVGSNLPVGKYLKKKSILREIHTANGGTVQGNYMMKRMMTDALIISFDGLHTMSFVFPSKHTAKPWKGDVSSYKK